MIRASMLCLCALALTCSVANAQSARPGVSLFPDCDKPELLAHGQPVMTFVAPHLAMGISIAGETFQAGEPIKLNVWVDNQAGAPVGVNTCWDLDFFKSRGFRILDGDGRRILSRGDAKACSADPAVTSIWVCSRNFPISIPAHSCVTQDSYDFSMNLADQYDLPPGEYTLRLQPASKEIQLRDVCKSEDQSRFQRQLRDLTFTVTP